jgi:P27 family predicted phage terminase small subunit
VNHYRIALALTLALVLLVGGCVAAGRWRDACEALRTLPEAERLLERDGKPQPLAKIARDSADQMMKLGASFGLSPSSRQRLSGVAKKPASKFAGYLGRNVDEPA